MKKAGIILGILCLAAIIGGWKYTEYKRSQIDLEGPVLTAVDDKVRVPIGAPDSELIKGVTAWDEKDKDVSGSIVIESINKKPDGESNEFEITYAAFDNSNNSGKLTRTLIYRDYRQPHFGISQPLRFSRNQNLSLFEYITADDCLDGDITPFVVIEGEKDIVAEAKTGIYNFTLQVSMSFS